VGPLNNSADRRSRRRPASLRVCARLACVTAVLSALVTCASAAPREQAPGVSAAPNESIVTARVANAVVVDASTLGGSPPQPLCVLTLRILSTKATGDLPPAISAKDTTVRAYTKRVELTRLKGTTVTAVLTNKGDERGQQLWLVRIEEPKAPR